MDNPVFNYQKEDEQERLDRIKKTWSREPSKVSLIESDLVYSIYDTPPWYTCLLLGFQHFLMSLSGVITQPILMAPYICLTDNVHLSELINSGLFINGLATLLQALFGVRLPIIQGGTVAFLITTQSLATIPRWKCTTHAFNTTDNSTEQTNTTQLDGEQWKVRMCELQGAIIVASLCEVLAGISGVMGTLLKYIGPLVVALVLALIGLSLFETAAKYCASNWLFSFITIVLVLLFSLYLNHIDFPCYYYDRRKGCLTKGFPMFQLFPVILAVAITWFLSIILTSNGAFSKDPTHWTYNARSDIRTEVLHNSQWFRFPYPGQWGSPSISLAGVLGMLSAIMISIIESLGDYYVCAKLSGAPSPPIHAINRGIFMEGIGSTLSGLWGTGMGTTSYSNNVAAIGMTKVGSRRVVIYSSIIMLVLGTLGKFGALFVTIPDPILGGIIMSLFGMIAAVGLSTLQYADMNSSRNLIIFGFALLFGISIPQWIAKHPNNIATGYETLDQILQVLFSTGIFVGGVVAVFLDNTVPGSRKERGLHMWDKPVHSKDEQTSIMRCYDLPWGMDCIRKTRWMKYIPISPTFTSFICHSRGKIHNNHGELTVTATETTEQYINSIL